MKKLRYLLTLGSVAFATQAWGAISAADRVYTADQNSNTVSVIDPSTNKLLGQIRLGNPRPDVLSPLYKGQINVHGLGFSPDHKTLAVVSNGSNSVSFIDTETNEVKGVSYIGRSPHEGFFTVDGKEFWTVVRGEDYISVIDPVSFKEKTRIQTAIGPGMVLFEPTGKRAFMVSSFAPEVDVIDVAKKQVIKRIPVTSPFSPFLQFTPDHKEMWMTHKDVGKVTRIDTETLEVKEVFDSGMVTNHIGFANTKRGTLAYVTVGGENAVKVYTTGPRAELVATISVGALPHGIWASDDGTRMYVGLENADAVDVIDTANDKVVSRIPVGQAPQALVYVSNAVKGGDGRANLAPPANAMPVNIRLQSTGGDQKGAVVARNMGIMDALEISLSKLKPQTVYSVYMGSQPQPVATVRTNEKGAANATAIGPFREIVSALSAEPVREAQVFVTEGEGAGDPSKAVLRNKQQ